MHPIIRQSNKEDRPAIKRLLLDTWITTYTNLYRGITEEDIRALFDKPPSESLGPKPSSHTTFVAENNGFLIGCATVLFFEDYSELRVLYISPDYQGQGIGTLLLNKAKEVAFFPLKLIVVDYNIAAQIFYLGQGFTYTGRTFENTELVLPISNKKFTVKELICTKPTVDKSPMSI